MQQVSVGSIRSWVVVGMIASIFGSASVAGEVDPKQDKWHKKYKTQANVPKPADMLLNTDDEPDVKEGFTPMFNGKDLTGWAPQGWRVSV